VVRNEGDLSWTAAEDFKFGQKEYLEGEVLFGAKRYLIDDTQDEIPIYGGIFRGRPIVFEFDLIAPPTEGDYLTHWGMLQENVAWFGEELVVPITVVLESVLLGDVNLDGDVNGLDVDLFVACLLAGGNQAEADMNEDGWVNGLDVAPFVEAIISGASTTGAATVPEPSTLVAFILGLIGITWIRRWH
jgi:hypothetical protein